MPQFSIKASYSLDIVVEAPNIEAAVDYGSTIVDEIDFDEFHLIIEGAPTDVANPIQLDEEGDEV